MNVGFKTPVTLGAEPAERSLDLRTYLNFLWRNWMFIGAVVALALLVGIIYLARATPIYTATAQILLDPQQEKVAGADSRFDRSSVRLRDDGEPAIDHQFRPALAPRRHQGAARPPPPATEHEPQSASDEDEKSAEAQRIQDAINRLRGALRVKRVGQSNAFDISITWADPERAAQLANAVADAYIVDQLDTRLEAAKRASGWLSDRLVELRKQLRDSEEAVAKFRKDNGLAPHELQSSRSTNSSFRILTASFWRRGPMPRKRKRALIFSMTSSPARKRSILCRIRLQSGSVMAALRAKLADASQREADLLARYSSRHPAVVNVEAEKRDIERSIAAETQRMAQTVRSEYALAKARESAMEQAMREATGQGGLDSDAAIRLRELERTAAVNKSLFEDFLQKAKISDEQSTFQARDARIVMPAQPGGQSFPDSQQDLDDGASGGSRPWRRRRVPDRDVKSWLHHPAPSGGFARLPVLASIQQMEDSKLKKKGTILPVPLYQVEHPLSPLAKQCGRCEVASTCWMSISRRRSSTLPRRARVRARQRSQ